MYVSASLFPSGIDKIGINTSTLQRPRNPPPPAPPAIYTTTTTAPAAVSRLTDDQSNESLSATCSEGVLANPLPPPRKPPRDWTKYISGRRCFRALFNCEADYEDELSFRKGDIILVTNMHTGDDNWVEGFLERAPKQKGMIPINFVQMLQD